MSTVAPDYEAWAQTCDTLHAHVQVLGKLAATLAPPEPRFQHGALRLSYRGWETLPLPAPNGSGLFVAGLDLRLHEAFVEHSSGAGLRVHLAPDRSVAEVTGEVLGAVIGLAGEVRIDPAPAEVWWDTPLDADHEHHSYDADAVAAYFSAATEVSRALTSFRAPYLGLSTPVNAWWGSFDLSVSLFSPEPGAGAPLDAHEVAVGWWPGDPNYPKAAFYAYVKPSGDEHPALSPPAARWDEKLGEYVLDWTDVKASHEPRQAVIDFARSAWQSAVDAGSWDPALAPDAHQDA